MVTVMRIDVYHHFDFNATQTLERLEGKIDNMNAEIRAFVTSVTGTLNDIAAGLQKVSVDEDVILQKLVDLQGSSTLSADDQAALAEVVTLATNLKSQVDGIDAKIPDAPPVGESPVV